MKVLVTGGAGFIGSHVVEKLIAEQCQVVVLDNLSTGLKEHIPTGVPFVEMDIRSGDLLDLFEQEKFDAVIHLAAQTMVPVSLDKPAFDCDVNVLGTVNVLEACRKTGVKRIAFASSAAVYGDVSSVPIVETEQTAPASFYGLSKLVVEKYLQLYHQVFGLEYVALRYANVFGERQGDGGEGGVISIFTRKVSKGETLTVFGDGGQTRDFIYVGDVAAANYQALITDNVNRVYNISTQQETSVNDLINTLEKIHGAAIEKVYTAPREGDIYRSALSNQAATTLLGWQPKTDLNAGLERTFHSLKG